MINKRLAHAGKSSFKTLIRRQWQLWVLILPAVAAVFIFHYIPIYGVQIAFREYRPTRGFFGSDWVGFSHFVRFVTFPDFWKIVRNTVIISLYGLATFPLPIILALMINEVGGKKYKRFVQMVSYAPHFVSTVILCSMVILFTRYDNGLLNNFRVFFGFKKMDFITVPEYFASIYVWSGVWQNIGWNTIIYLAAMSAVSPELIEAAKIDGAGRLRVVVHVIIPSILPTIITLLILNTGSILSVGFEKIFLLQNPLNTPASRVISTYVYEIGIRGAQFSYSTAIGLFNNVVNIIVIITVNRIAKIVSSVSL